MSKKQAPIPYGRRQSDALRDFLHNAHGQPCEKQKHIASINHELRTPLNAVIGFAEIIEKQLHGELQEQYIEYAKHIQESGHDLLSKIEKLLTTPAPEGPRRGNVQAAPPRRKIKKLVEVD